MPYLRTFYKQTGALPEGITFLGPAYEIGSYLSGAGLSTRTPAPYLIACLAPGTGSITVGAYQLMSAYFGSTVFSSGYVYIPVGIAVQGVSAASMGTAGNGQLPIGIAALQSVVSLAKSLGGASGGIGMGPYNSGSTAHFAVYGVSISGTAAVPTWAISCDTYVTFLMVSAPPFHELGP